MMFRVLGLVALLLVAGVASARADVVADGQSAYLRGDYRAAWSDLRGAAEQGNAEAQYLVGTMYDHGQGVARSYASAAQWYRKAAVQGHAAAQFSLGFMYYNGTGEDGGAVAQQPAEAFRWLERAARNGVAGAQQLVGQMYLRGRGTPRDEAKGMVWLRRAATSGASGARYDLALILGARNDLADVVESYTWFAVLAAQGYPNAARNRVAVAKRLTQADIAEGERRAQAVLGK